MKKYQHEIGPKSGFDVAFAFTYFAQMAWSEGEW